MKVYVVYELICCMGIEQNILGIFEPIYKAKECYLKAIEKHKSNGYMIDKDCNLASETFSKNYTRLFRGFQENWGDYVEISIKEMEVEK